MKYNATFAKNLDKENLETKEEHIKAARQKYDAYDTSKWKKKYFDNKTGGYLAVEKDRVLQAKKHDNERDKFNREQGMNMTLARNGYAIEHLDDQKYGYDIHLNGIKADLKKTGSHNNMVRYAKKAIREQGAEVVVFELENNTKKIQEELDKLKRLDIKVIYYFSNNKSKMHYI